MSYCHIDTEKFKHDADGNQADAASLRTLFLSLSSIAELSYRFDDMCAFIREVVIAAKEGDDLSHEERNLLSVAYKNSVGSRRAAWRAASIEQNINQESLRAFNSKIEDELAEYCISILDLLENVLIPHPRSEEPSTVFYLKMAGDYYRYLSEFTQNDKLTQYQQDSAKYYRRAMEIAQSIMTPADPTRLGLALNYSVCLYEIMRSHDEACSLAKRAYEEALRESQNSGKNISKDARLILNLLHDNLALWTQSPSHK